MIEKSLYLYFVTLQSILLCKFIKRINYRLYVIYTVDCVLQIYIYIYIYMLIFKTTVCPTNIFTPCCLHNLHIICFSGDTINEVESVQ